MPINQSAINLLDQLRRVVSQLDPGQFQRPLPTLSGSSIGQHVRHTLEFFLCLMDAETEKKINYDLRKRDQFIEQDSRLAISIIDSIQAYLMSPPKDYAIQMEANYETDQDETVRIPTSYLRELAYNIEHAIHHMALIKIGLIASFPDTQIPPHFGVASSTVRYQKSQKAE